MKNFEAYEDKIKELNYAFGMNKDSELVDCSSISCDRKQCMFEKPRRSCPLVKLEWLYKEYKKPKIKIPLATKVILESLDEKWKWIVRDKNNDVICFENKPVKRKKIWVSSVMDGKNHNLTYIFKNDTFDSLSWEDEEPTNIKELLENCEVVEDE